MRRFASLTAAMLLALGCSGCSALFFQEELPDPGPTAEQLAAEAANQLGIEALDLPCFPTGHRPKLSKRTKMAQILIHPLAADSALGSRAWIAAIFEPRLIDTLQRRGYDVLDHNYLDTELANALGGTGRFLADVVVEGVEKPPLPALRNAIIGEAFEDLGLDAVLFTSLRRVEAQVEDNAASWCNVREPLRSAIEPSEIETKPTPPPVLWATCIEAQIFLVGPDGIDFGRPLLNGRGGVELLSDDDGDGDDNNAGGQPKS
ncbi:MAG: hypothetical protein ACI91F_003389, partial [Candidatus Binatia bacterium]